MEDEKQNKKIKKILDQIIKETWKKDYQAGVSDEQAMGILLSHYFGWDGVKILQATYSGLEDSNFHVDNLEIAKLLEKYKVRV